MTVASLTATEAIFPVVEDPDNKKRLSIDCCIESDISLKDTFDL